MDHTIFSFVINPSMELLAELTSETDTHFYISNPVAFTLQSDRDNNLIPVQIPLTIFGDLKEAIPFNKNMVMMKLPASEQAKQMYSEMFGKIIVPQTPNIIIQ